MVILIAGMERRVETGTIVDLVMDLLQHKAKDIDNYRQRVQSCSSRDSMLLFITSKIADFLKKKIISNIVSMYSCGFN